MKQAMLRGAFIFVLSLFSIGAFADTAAFSVSLTDSPIVSADCPATPNYYDANFCATFPPVAVCQCKETAPAGFCMSAQVAFQTMMNVFHSIPEGCAYAVKKHIIPTADEKNCEYRWNCFEYGGSFEGHQCNGNGQACPH